MNSELTNPSPLPAGDPAGSQRPPFPAFTREQAESILELFEDPCASLRDIARDCNVSPESLAAWLASPDADARLRVTESLCARRVRLIASTMLPRVADACDAILQEYTHESRHTPVAPNLLAREQRRRAQETARKAASLLARLARFAHGPARPSCSTAAHGVAPAPAGTITEPVRNPGVPAPGEMPSPRTADGPQTQDGPPPRSDRGRCADDTPAGPVSSFADADPASDAGAERLGMSEQRFPIHRHAPRAPPDRVPA